MQPSARSDLLIGHRSMLNDVPRRCQSSSGKDPRREFRFSVVVGATCNAFALPGGFVFITEPLVDLCGHDEAEIAFYLGHEMAHILRGHAKDQLTTRTFLSAVTARLAGAGPMLRQVLAKGYSRDLELEADREGVDLMVAAGFDPRAAVRGLRRLAQASTDNVRPLEFFSLLTPVRNGAISAGLGRSQ